MNIESIVTVVLGFIGGGGLTYIVNAAAVKRKAAAEAKTSELDNVQEAIKIWRETAEQMTEKLKNSEDNYAAVTKELESLRSEVKKLTSVNRKLIDLINKISHDNLEEVQETLKKIEAHEA